MKLLEQYKEADRHFSYCYKKDEFFVKRDYSKNDQSTKEELEMAIKFCEAMMDTYHNQIKELSGSAQKAVCNIKDKLLGEKRGT